MTKNDIDLIGHLMRRAGFGATLPELECLAAKGYEAVVEDLINPDLSTSAGMSDDLIRRYHPEHSGMMGQHAPGSHWMYSLISSERPLHEKMTLFWHNIFATGYSKIIQGKVLYDQIRMFRRLGMGNVKQILIELAKDPAMIIWLDNQDNHKGSINENFGRELLELFSMGVGNYSETDIKECARAFTGWSIANTEYNQLRTMRDSIWPYGRLGWHFEFKQDDHDDQEKEFLGHKGYFDGEDIIGIICEQEATAHFIARHLYHFFVADEPPVAQWPYQQPRDPSAIELLSQAYFDSNYDISSMLRVLFNSDFFKSRDIRFEKIKSPAELVVGVLRISGEFDKPRREIGDRNAQTSFMGQYLTSPPSVEGWHQGQEWIDTGTLFERINFSSSQFGDLNKMGTKAMIDRIMEAIDEKDSPEALVSRCLDELGSISISEDTRSSLVGLASASDSVHRTNGGRSSMVSQLLQMIVVTPEFQRS